MSIDLERSSFAIPAAEFKAAMNWWNSRTETQQKVLIREHKLVTWEHMTKLHRALTAN